MIFKLGADGTGDLISLEDVSKVASFRGFSHTQFRQTCILSGCDYLPSLPKIGMGTAIRLMQANRSVDAIFKVLKSPTNNYDEKEIDTYIKTFILADLTFSHQRVWDPRKKVIVTLEPISTALSTNSLIPQDLINVLLTNDTDLISSTSEDWPLPVHQLEFLGPPVVDSHIASGIVLGAICPITKKTLNSSLLPTNQEIFAVQILKEPLEKKKLRKLPWLTRLSLKPMLSTVNDENISKENVPPFPELVEAHNPLLSKQPGLGVADQLLSVVVENETKRRKISPYFGNKKAVPLPAEFHLSK